MSRYGGDSERPCPDCGLLHPTLARAECPLRRQALDEEADREDEARERAEAAIEAARERQAAAPESVEDRARAAVAEADPAVKAEVEAVVKRLAGVPQDEATHQRAWLRLMADLPWDEPPAKRRGGLAALRALDAAHGGHAGVKAILADRVAAAAHLERV